MTLLFPVAFSSWPNCFVMNNDNNNNYPTAAGVVAGPAESGHRIIEDYDAALKIKVVHGSNQFEVAVPSHSSFGDVKRLLAQQIGLEPKRQNLLFRGKEKDDEEYLNNVGVKDNAKLLLMEDPISIESEIEEPEICQFSSGSPATADIRPELASTEVGGKDRKHEDEDSKKFSRVSIAVAAVRREVDKLAEQVAALEATIHVGTKPEDKEFVILTELLMRQLLKLDSIEAEGEEKVQRKLEVRRVQNLVDKVDSLKAVNSNPFSNNSKDVSVTTTWETFDSGTGSLSTPPPPMPSSSTNVTQDWEQFE